MSAGPTAAAAVVLLGFIVWLCSQMAITDAKADTLVVIGVCMLVSLLALAAGTLGLRTMVRGPSATIRRALPRRRQVVGHAPSPTVKTLIS